MPFLEALGRRVWVGKSVGGKALGNGWSEPFLFLTSKRLSGPLLCLFLAHTVLLRAALVKPSDPRAKQ